MSPQSMLILFADDFAFFAENREVIQQFYYECCRWALQAGMVWAVSKCTTISPNPNVTRLYLSEGRLDNSTHAIYLGMSLTPNGISTENSVLRIKAAKQRLDQLCRSFRARKLDILKKNNNLVASLITTMAEIGVTCWNARHKLKVPPKIYCLIRQDGDRGSYLLELELL